MKGPLIVAGTAGVALFATALGFGLGPEFAARLDPIASPVSTVAAAPAKSTAAPESASPKNSRAAYGAYDALTESYPDDFGYVSVDASSGALTIPVATERGRDLLASMQRGEAPKRPALPGEGAESATKRQKVLAEAAAGAAGVPVTTVATGRSRSAIERDSNRILDASADPRFADADIWQTAPDPATGRVVVTVSNRTAGLEDALAAEFGADTITIEVAPNPGLSTL